MANPALKSQDLLVLAKILAGAGPRPSIGEMAVALSISPSEIHGGLRRLTRVRLLTDAGGRHEPMAAAVEELLVHGLKYLFPAARGTVTMGLPTSYAALSTRPAPAEPAELPPVWPMAGGSMQGIAFEPIYKTAPLAAQRDRTLYEVLALIDALRDPDRAADPGRMRALLRDQI